ncbi:ATP-dependent helicase [Actinoplanes sp. SE50]|uniref:ATP-dependent DNA helicase n=1 Tax=unclassified Actinoplanes TaxID=2626549 RepID=UPI00023EDF35|nr:MULTISPECIES: ATP-dependent DNA helicase [unclassified Actinoplanes]AEV88838.1 ATP-dependent DNA helicase DinG [Actinoplanes sp. SE50/110]ATO87244.1 ATP-dependent helicase [Actinoplanes sp. SE50]SLM04662.1 ATP-dependent helicase [Actinoplanes sp. SE50/110]
MVAAIEKAITDREHLLVQAGTGTGKSLGYLTPALLVEGPVVVSTATLALQNQLVEHDLPRLAAAVEPLLGRKPSFAVLKGRHHYLCMAKLEHADEQAPTDTLFDDAPAPKAGQWLGEAGRLGKQVVRIRKWADKTQTGDRDELDPGVDDTAWRSVSMPARDCVGAARCPYGQECFAEASRVRAREADIVVTNHSLLAVDMLSERHIIPPHKLLVVDEAHELAERVSSASQAELTPEAVERAGRRARTLIPPATADALAEAADALTVGLADVPPGRLTDGLPDGLRQAVTLLESATRAGLTAIGDVKSDDPDPVRKQQAKAVLDELSGTAQRLLEEDEFDVAWVEKSEIGAGRKALVVAPLSVHGTLSQALYADRTVVAASATLTLGGRFDTVARSLGLPVAAAEDTSGDGWTSLDVGSPFDYPKQGILYVAAHLPRPMASGLPDAAADELLKLVQALGGRTLGLFSSRRAAAQAAELLRAKTDLPILLQGDETLPILVRKFREERNSCLFGVMSLWQGVDVPGDACQLVVIDRLPFPRPDEPLAAARAAAADAARPGSGFSSVSVPIAAVRLAQGVGRLIRSTGDKGVVAVLDSRLETARGYGSFLRRSLPPFWYTTRSEVAIGALERLAKS